MSSTAPGTGESGQHAAEPGEYGFVLGDSAERLQRLVSSSRSGWGCYAPLTRGETARWRLVALIGVVVRAVWGYYRRVDEQQRRRDRTSGPGGADTIEVIGGPPAR